MLNSIRETRIRLDDGMYKLILEMPEEDFFGVYDDVELEAAVDIVKQYLRYHDDDARPKDVKINYNRNAHMIDIISELDYLGNDHTDY